MADSNLTLFELLFATRFDKMLISEPVAWKKMSEPVTWEKAGYLVIVLNSYAGLNGGWDSFWNRYWPLNKYASKLY